MTQAVADAQAKILAYLANPVQGQTFGHLMAVLGFDYTDPYSLSKARRIDGVAESRVLDRALQKLRKAGKVTFDHKVGWSLHSPLTAGGFLVAAGDEAETIRAIRRIGGILGDDDLAAECIADLPAEDLP